MGWRWLGIENVIEYRLTRDWRKRARKPLLIAGNCISANPKFILGGMEGTRIPRQTRAYGARERPPVSPLFRVHVPQFETPGSVTETTSELTQ